MTQRKAFQHQQLMERMDKLTVALERGNAINLAHLELRVQEPKKDAPKTARRVLASADEQIKAALEQQQARLNKEESDG